MNSYISVVLTVIIIEAICFSQIGETYMSHEDEALRQVSGQCSEKHKISNEAIKSIWNHEYVADDHEVKCWLSCLMKKLGMIKDGKIDWEHCKNLTKHGLTSEEDKAKVDKIAEICQAKVPQEEKDECQLAYSAAVCKIYNWKELGLPTGNMEQ